MNWYPTNTVTTDGLVLSHQGISSHSAENAPVRFLLFIGKHTVVDIFTSVFNNNSSKREEPKYNESTWGASFIDMD